MAASEPISSCFSSDYRQAREKFVASSEAAGARVVSYENPNRGPEGEDLHTDVALMGPESARATLILQSGTHGVEAFAGSAIEIALLRDALLADLTQRLRLVLIHAINPWGFAHLRRVNEDNVDLNRNFVDRSKPYPENAAYRELARILAPTELSWPTRIVSLARLKGYSLVHGRAALQAAVVRGQYSDPDGLFFGGHRDVWSNATFREILMHHVAGAHRVVFIDLHTGLGPSGYGELILDDPKESAAYRRAVSWWGDRVKTTSSKESVSIDVAGSVTLAARSLLDGASVTAATLELGTVAAHRALWALIAENWAHHQLTPEDPRFAKLRARLRQAFCIDSETWRSAVWRQAKDVVSQAFLGLTA